MYTLLRYHCAMFHYLYRFVIIGHCLSIILQCFDIIIHCGIIMQCCTIIITLQNFMCVWVAGTLSRAERQTNMVTDFSVKLKNVITSKLREIVSSVHSADNCNIAEELQEIQKLVIVLVSLTRIPEDIFILLSSSWSIFWTSEFEHQRKCYFHWITR